jgi:hypothetical protein
MLDDRSFRDKLRSGNDPNAVKALLTSWPDALAAS